MERKLRLSALQWLGIIILGILIISVRFFENQWFYDPFLQAFKKSQYQMVPYQSGRLFLNYLLRFGINTGASLGILWLVFKDASVIKLSAIIYLVLFIILSLALFVVLQTEEPSLKAIFYIRRFMIQPLLILLFLPAFYYQKYMAK